ncbi:hypothetical protein RRG08_037994 [Elysia crispata]|uniref:Uncharacterized protein n=1 Tax=Elysia crispata TaxID=231223 RepID=A0AAE1DW92_9GAST|nr:hypothetical protein RRG08_037994 [Elysia crispata]
MESILNNLTKSEINLNVLETIPPIESSRAPPHYPGEEVMTLETEEVSASSVKSGGSPSPGQLFRGESRRDQVSLLMVICQAVYSALTLFKQWSPPSAPIEELS